MRPNLSAVVQDQREPNTAKLIDADSICRIACHVDEDLTVLIRIVGEVASRFSKDVANPPFVNRDRRHRRP